MLIYPTRSHFRAKNVITGRLYVRKYGIPLAWNASIGHSKTQLIGMLLEIFKQVLFYLYSVIGEST